MRFVLPLGLVAAVLFSSTTAAAQIYEEAAASGVKPTTQAEFFDCALFTDAWAQSLDPNFHGPGSGIWDGGWLSKQNPAVQLPAAADTARKWHEKTKASYAKSGKLKEFASEWENRRKFELIALDWRFFFKKLGECQLP